jgi:hypothetical protein
MQMQLSRPRTSKHGLALLLALACGTGGVALALHYPLAPWLALALWLGAATLGFAAWRSLALLVPALVPLLGFAPWTGWFTFEELDLLVLAVACGGYAALALGAAAQARAPMWQRPLAWSALAKLLLALFAASLALAVWRGVEQAGGWRFGWWQGYHEPMNSLRQGKSLFLALLLLPLWRAAGAQRPQAVARLLGLALVLALAGAALAALWERLAFTGLLNFSSDYRTTALFWETHVGGAPLDACLALTIPFALAWALRERLPARFALALALLLLAAYVTLSTFSRGLYLALPLGVGLTLLLLARQRRSQLRASALQWQRRGLLALLLAGFGLAAWPLFQGGGYRALLALAGSALLLIALPERRLAASSGRQQLIVLLLALMLASVGGLACWVLAQRIPKAAYVLDGAAVLGGLALCWVWRAGMSRHLQMCLLAAAWFLSLACAAVVAGYWGGERGQLLALPPLLLLALGWSVLQLLPGPAAALLPMLSWRAKALLWVGCLIVAVGIGTFAGGAYIGDRLAAGQRDLQGRMAHWRLGLSLLDGQEEWLLGKGTGRFADSYFYAGPEVLQVGDYRLHEAGEGKGGNYLRLSAGRHVLGWGELFRVSQRIAPPTGLLQLQARVRAEQDLSLHLDLCEKHLLYSERCINANLAVKGGAGWQDLSLDLGPAPALGGAAWAPRLVAFSVALGSAGTHVDIGRLGLRDAGGRELLDNGDFGAGMAHWFSTSDRHHLPWHMKSLPLHLLFEQGLVGLALGTALLVAALWRCTLGHGRRHALAPAVAGALLGFVIVGLFDSLIDAPRIGFLFFAVLALGLGLRAPALPKA